MSGGLVVLFAVATGLSVANNYLAQPLLDTIRLEFGVSTDVAGLIVTAAQLGYAAGLVLLLPLGDLFERRRLVTVLAVCTAGFLTAAGARPVDRRPAGRDGARRRDVDHGPDPRPLRRLAWRTTPSAGASSARS